MSVTTARLLFLTLPILALLLLTAVPAQSNVWHLQNKNDGEVVIASSGESITVTLTSETIAGHRLTYGNPFSTNKNVVAPDGDSLVNFKTIGGNKEGTANITAVVKCEKTTEADEECPDPMHPWVVIVKVHQLNDT